ncbi:hypothetical protein C884_01026 [Kocuria palustris PEL]|uniref:Uncharacterized protein n=1 Tax=Kocuria palustris PEL TaxID=1236550 RepID=M2WGG6_9MICC|nr:hypothetical protein C884_01026 [Kocuria palustris PEL]
MDHRTRSTVSTPTLHEILEVSEDAESWGDPRGRRLGSCLGR